MGLAGQKLDLAIAFKKLSVGRQVRAVADDLEREIGMAVADPLEGLDEDVNPFALEGMADEQGIAAILAGFSARHGGYGGDRDKVGKDEGWGVVSQRQFVELVREIEPERIGAAKQSRDIK